ncbi:hypothetical protein L1D55_10025 [Vibrio sp. Isolate22]|uniref:hypothetical protein n=1 Tax=Vibrio sp. Isolate22 TaxID=2908532 RepID=UPI001EFD5855|nr:hypothetical protein [Vibrio sp. Isolate22]MCG9692084.1 hypothetical protein [Vibrio sp. Isolate22]
MNNLTPVTPITIRSKYWQNVFSVMLMLTLGVTVIVAAFVLNDLGTQLGIERNVSELIWATPLLAVCFAWLAYLRSQELKKIIELRDRGEKHYPLKEITKEQLEIMGVWGGVFPHIKDFIDRCISQNALVTEEDYLLARKDVLNRLHITESHQN